MFVKDIFVDHSINNKVYIRPICSKNILHQVAHQKHPISTYDVKGRITREALLSVATNCHI